MTPPHYGVEVTKSSGSPVAPDDGDIEVIHASSSDFARMPVVVYGDGEFLISYSRLTANHPAWRAKLRRWE